MYDIKWDEFYDAKCRLHQIDHLDPVTHQAAPVIDH